MLELLFCLVVAVTDGDTLRASCDGQEVRVRLVDIDAPERRQAFGARARQYLSSLYGVQPEIQWRSKDRYGRVLGRVRCRGRDANAEMVRAGLAWVFDRYVADERLYHVQATARNLRRGLWADDEPVPPWEWRRAKRRR